MASKKNSVSVEIYSAIAKPYHKRSYEKVGLKLRAKITSLLGSLKRRGKNQGIDTKTTRRELTTLLSVSYGQPCCYCGKQLLLGNMACDHIHPLTKGGVNDVCNLQFICKTCNTRKGPMDVAEWRKFNSFVRHLSKDSAKYVLRQMAKGGKW
jgi:5-methylcytosine-specific restriction endonuclease McrA